MNNTANAISTMVHLQRGTELFENSPAQESAGHNQAITAIRLNIEKYGKTAVAQLVRHIEHLQDAFLHHLSEVVSGSGAKITEKVLFTLGQEDTLLIEYQEENEKLLAALSSNAQLRSILQELKESSLMLRGLQYFQNDAQTVHTQPLPDYKVCLSGSLSHFYLRDA